MPHLYASFIKKSVTPWLTWVRGGVTINLPEVIQEGLSSELAKSIGEVGWLADLYGRVVKRWAESRQSRMAL